MGSFDILIYKIKCPKCRKQREWELQFKALVDNIRDLEDYPKYFKVDDEIVTERNVIFGIGNCPICKSSKNVLIKIKNGIVTKDYEFDNRDFKRWFK